MILHFYHKEEVLPKLLQWFSFGTKNHVSIQLDDVIYEAIGGRLGTSGVFMSGDVYCYHPEKKKDWSLVSIKVNIQNKSSVKDFLRNQVGKGYDYRGIYGFLLRFIKHNENKWYCSELGAEALRIGGWKINQTRVSPSALFDIVQNFKQQ